MISSTFPIALAGTIASLIFAAMFIYLVTKWSLKRVKEMEKQLETERIMIEPKEITSKLEQQTPQQLQEQKPSDIDNRINEFRTKYNEAVNKGDKRMADIFSNEIKRLEKEKRVL
jgi:uncharacterized membrane protein YhiD involved in acid resistance